jgi:ribonuclease HI
MDDGDVECLNDGCHTHYHIQTDTYSCIDLSLCSSDAMLDFKFKVLDPDDILPYSSDHYPILLTKCQGQPPSSLPSRWNIRKADWGAYMDLTEISSSPEEFMGVEEALLYLQDAIYLAASNSIPKINGNHNKISSPWWTCECSEAVKRKRNASRRYQKSKQLVDKIYFKRLAATARKTIRQAKNNSWRQYVSSINRLTPISAVWKRIKKMKSKYAAPRLPVIIDNGTLIGDQTEVANAIASSFAQTSSGEKYSRNFKLFKGRIERIKRDFSSESGEEYNADFTATEYTSALGKCKNSSPGPDNINYDMIRRLHPSASVFLLDLYNRIWNEGYLPATWLEAVVVPILKPSRQGVNPKDYRPIALTSCLCKLMERMVSSRLVWFLENKNILNPCQFGFRNQRSTQDPLIRLEHDIRSAFTEGRFLYAIFFDIEKAYDTTWRRGIMEKLFQVGLRGSLPIFIQNFFENRYFRVRIGTNYSEKHHQLEGVPQGSVIGVICFLLAINDITSVLPPGISSSLYADDLVLYSTGRRLPLLTRRLQMSVNKIAKWAEMRGFQFSTSKTVSLLFHKKRRKPSHSYLYLYNRPIPIVKSTKFLGMIFDDRLNWVNHLKHIRSSCQSSLSLMKHLSHNAWGADRSSLRMIYQAFIQSRLSYGAHVFSSATANKLRMVEPIRNQGLRLITGAFRSSPIESLHVDCNMLPLRFFYDLECAKYYVGCQQKNNIVADMVRMSYQRDEQWNFVFRAKRIMEVIPMGDTIDIQINKWELCPPWRSSHAKLCVFIRDGCKQGSVEEARGCFLEHMGVHNSDISIYTDGSKSDRGVGSAVFVPSLGLSDHRALHIVASVFTAELHAILMALHILRMLPLMNFTIFSDSKSALFSLSTNNRTHPLIQEIQSWLFRIASVYKKNIQFCWVPGHVGIEHNEHVDRMAKNAVHLKNKLNNIPFSDVCPALLQSARGQWQHHWNTQLNNKLHSVKPRLGIWESSCQKTRKQEVILSRLRIGHTRLTHGYLMSREEPPMCTQCNTVLTINHIISECPLVEQIRRRHFPSVRVMPNVQRLIHILGEGTTFDLRNVLAFIEEINVLKQI